MRDGTLVRHVGSKGNAPGQFNRPSAVTVVPARAMGNDEAWLVVADEFNRRVQVLTRTGSVVRILQDDSVVELSSPFFRGLTVCVATGEVLVTDTDNHRMVSWRLADGDGLRVVCGGVEGMDSEDSDSDVEPDTGLFNGPWGVAVSVHCGWRTLTITGCVCFANRTGTSPMSSCTLAIRAQTNKLGNEHKGLTFPAFLACR